MIDYATETMKTYDFRSKNIQLKDIPYFPRGSSIIEINKYINNINLSIELEKSIFEFSILYSKENKCSELVESIYLSKVDELVTNFGRLGNKGLIKKIRKKKFDPYIIPSLTPLELYPENWSDYIRRQEYKKERDNNKTISTFYKCYKCGKSETKVTQIQTRSADEPSTNFIVCLTCNNTWKF